MASNVLSSHGAGSTPTPKKRFGVPKLANSIKGASPLMRTPGATVSVNNDDEERKQRRLVSHLRSVMSPTCSFSSSNTGSIIRVYPSESRGSSLSNTQISEHYANCIKLSSENKITARNAFGLHLIDYMLEMLQKRGELSNFQVAGCTLDASAKIYASRVDSIYSAAYKVLGGLGRGNTKDEETETDADKPISKENKKELLTTIERNQRALDLLSFDLEFEVDPVSKKLSTALDEGRDEGLLLHHLQTYDDYLVALDSSELATLKDSDTKPENLNYEEIQGFNVNAVNTLRMCPTFSTFTFADDQNMDNFDLEEYSNPCEGDGYLPLQPDYSMLPCPTVHDDSDSDDVLQLLDAEENVSSVDYKDDMIAIDETAERTTLGICGDKEVACVFPSTSNAWERQTNVVQPIWMGNLCLTDALQPSEYSYFDSSVVQTNVYPLHSKLNSQTHGTKLEAKRKVIRERRQLFKINFSDMPSEVIFIKAHNRTRGNPGQARKTMLPWDLYIHDDILLRLFCQQNWKLQRQKTSIANEDQLDDTWYNYGNPNDSAHYCSLSNQEEQDEIQDVLHYTSRRDSMNIFSDNISQVLYPEKMEHLELVAQPVTVQKMNIDYSRNMKRIDAKKLKCAMWDIISGNTECTNPEESRCMKFTDLYSQLPQYFHTSTMQDISIPICFVFLMHLANQKGLKIWKHDLNNFSLNVE